MVDPSAVVQQLLNGLTIGMVYVLLAAGLSIIFGVMDVINFAHGELFALGAYFAFAIVGTGWGNFWLALLIAPLFVAAVGAAMERFTIRPLYGRNPLYHILLTFGLVLIFKDVIEFVWGTQQRFFSAPRVISGPVDLAGITVSRYSFFVLLIGGAVALGAWLLLERTRFGLIVRAGSMDREMVRHLGIDIDRYYTLVFAFGAFLAAVGGIVFAGRTSVAPSMGDTVIIPAFVIVVLGGLGSFRGAVVGGLGVGVIQTMLRSPPVFADVVPDLEGLVVFLLMIGVLLVRPQGLFGNPEWHDPSEGGDLLTGGNGDGVVPDRAKTAIGGLVVVCLLLAPVMMGVLYPVYWVNSFLVTVLIWALFALSLDFVMGYAGLVSLGHVLFFGLGAYTSVLVWQYVTPSVFVAMGAGVVVAAVVAWIVGYLSIRVTGVYFAMITLGFAELFFNYVFKVEWTGSDNGIFGYSPVYGLTSGPEVGEVAIVGQMNVFYYFVLALVLGSYLLARRVMHAPFGSVLQSIRESEQRSEFLGYDTTAYKRRAFVVSGALAAVAGGLFAIDNGGVAPSYLAWIKSGEVIVMTILGGMGTLYGPMIGAAAYLGLKELLIGLNVEQWQGVLGLVFVLFVIFVPRGLVAVPQRLVDLLGPQFGRGGPPVGDATDPAEAADGEVND